MAKNLSEAERFCLDFDRLTAGERESGDGLVKILADYPGHEVGDGISFADGSRGVVRGDSFLIFA